MYTHMAQIGIYGGRRTHTHPSIHPSIMSHKATTPLTLTHTLADDADYALYTLLLSYQVLQMVVLALLLPY